MERTGSAAPWVGQGSKDPAVDQDIESCYTVFMVGSNGNKEQDMEDFAMFEEVGCEELYHPDMDAWLDELEIDYVNLELQEIADEIRESEVPVCG